ncbi:MAG: RNA-binding transcriptional accessory protein [Oscillospiraceae bacterium]|nr:RNA-binding transcriptional accessory protein [Oscillospiraceae bacterium]MBQ5324629.1 RNA-binding transcriptional accessory protein [Oscillospiraceae bacterium]
MDIIKVLASEFKKEVWQIENSVALMDEGCTIPFIARYRKEKTGELDDQILREIFDRLTYLRNLEQRKEEVIKSITEQEKMTDEIMEMLSRAKTLSEVEDIYRPFKPKRKTRASVAKEKGLEPLAKEIMEQRPLAVPMDLAAEYINAEKGVETAEDALKGAMDIIAEDVSDNTNVRKVLKNLYTRTGEVTSKGDESVESVYTQYYDFSEKVNKIASHRVLAIDRGEKEGFLKVNITVDSIAAIGEIEKIYIENSSRCAEIVKEAITDGYTRLLHPSLDTEIRNGLTDVACEGAIKLFGDNLKQLLLVPPVKGKTCMALDPGYRTGCKMAIVDATGKVLETGVVYMTLDIHDKDKAKAMLKKLIAKHNVDIISIGNGTATKETELVVASMLKELDRPVSYAVVSEAGASVYSASKLAAAEFPQFDVALRSAVSIARRLQDPLAELVKIDPKSIGVGQYQHDMPKQRLEESLDGVVEYCVNTVGVDLNTASAPLLERVSGLNKSIAKNIVAYREENGEFTKRNQLLKVSKLGPKAYLLSAGFLRIPGAKDKLDSSSVHPESYDAAKQLLAAVGYTTEDIGTEKITSLEKDVEKIGIEKLAEQLGVGVPTLKDIVAELIKPGRDMRDALPKPLLRTDVLDMNDLVAGMELTGTVRNVIDFGAFVDIGVHQDGLVHISQICDKYIKHPSEMLKVGDIVTVWVLSVDVNKKRISLTMRKPKEQNKDEKKAN